MTEQNGSVQRETTQGEAALDEGKQLYLVDAMALAYRAHYIFISRPLINSKGQNTSAAYGFTNSLLKLIDDHGIDHVAVVFDAAGEGGTFRDELYEEYKAHRDPPPDELLENLPFIKDIVRAMDIPVLEIPGVEADDVIGTLARRAEADGAEAVIVSADKDFKQLLTERIALFRPAHRGESFDLVTADSFREEYDLEPHQFIDMLALWGDTSDNVPGVPLIGEKTSMKLLREYGDVEGVLAHAEEVGGKRGESLTEHAEQARLSRKLVTIKTDVEVDFDWHTLRRQTPDTEVLQQIFAELEFDSFMERIDGSNGAAPEKKASSEDPALAFDFGPYEEVTALDADEVSYEIVRNRQQLEALVERLKEKERLAFDTETTSTDAMIASLVGLSLSWAEGEAAYVPTPLPDGASTDDVLDAVVPLLHRKQLVGHNLKYDLIVMERHGAPLRADLFDTMVAHYLIAPQENHGLDDVTRKYLSYRMTPIETLIGTGKDQVTMRDVEINEAGPYACEDADMALRLAGVLREKLAEDKLQEVAADIEFPLVDVLARMEQHGIRVDRDILSDISSKLAGQLKDLQDEVHELAGLEFNINSTQQLGEVLFEKLDLPVKAKTSTGRPSTKESVLQELSTEHPLPGLVLDWRSLSKLKSTYLDSLGDLVHPETGRIHTSFNQTITATGRLSSSSPNLQNIPVRTAIGREIRKAFVPEEGWTLLAADYAQIELRILASMSGDEAMQETFRAGGDIHTDAAARVYDVAPSRVTRDQRRKAKEVNYGIPYGVSAWGLAQRLRTTVGEAQTLIDQYRKSYPGVSRLLVDLVERAREKGYAETLRGRRRYVPEIDDRNSRRRSFAERVAVNMPIQGTQADMIKIAMIHIQRRLDEEKMQARMLLQVHDELVFEAPLEETEALAALVNEEMETALPLEVPVVVDIDTGANWLDAH